MNLGLQDARLHFHDFSVGQQFVLGTLIVTAAEICEFASEFDPQPFHLDEESAQNLNDSATSSLATSPTVVRVAF